MGYRVAPCTHAAGEQRALLRPLSLVLGDWRRIALGTKLQSVPGFPFRWVSERLANNSRWKSQCWALAIFKQLVIYYICCLDGISAKLPALLGHLLCNSP